MSGCTSAQHSAALAPLRSGESSGLGASTIADEWTVFYPTGWPMEQTLEERLRGLSKGKHGLGFIQTMLERGDFAPADVPKVLVWLKTEGARREREFLRTPEGSQIRAADAAERAARWSKWSMLIALAALALAAWPYMRCASSVFCWPRSTALSSL